jgi:hypothetical protein
VEADARIRSLSRLTLALVLTISFPVIPVAAQSINPGPPGPFVFDIRAATSGIPSSDALFPDLAVGELVPTRGFGGSIGGHVYAIQIGPTRLGIGADVMLVRGSTSAVSSTFLSLDPQLSVNFGTSEGWSYLSAGVGPVRVNSDPAGVSDTVRAINWGGGARWFLGPHLGVGFDVRVRHLAASEVLPKGTVLSAAVGISMK